MLRGPPANLDQLEEMFRGNTMDGSTAFVPGDDYGEEQEGAEDAWPEEADEDNVPTPRSSSSQKSKRSLGSLTSTCDILVKKSKSPMVRYVKDIANTFKEAVQVNNKELKKRTDYKETHSVKRCQQLSFECSICWQFLSRYRICDDLGNNLRIACWRSLVQSPEMRVPNPS